jgi:hypothetical protein
MISISDMVCHCMTLLRQVEHFQPPLLAETALFSASMNRAAKPHKSRQVSASERRLRA